MDPTEIHLCVVRLAVSEMRIPEFFNLLSETERRIALSFRRESQKQRYTITHGLLRSILGWYVGCRAEDIVFRYGPKGKPSLQCPSKPALYFNLAHSEQCALYGFCQGSELGVDLEFIRELPEAETLAKQFFSEQEATEIHNVSSTLRTEAFLNCWTRKEAYVKATGEGLSSPLNEFCVSLLPGEPPEFRVLNGPTGPIEKWTLLHLKPSQEYVGAVAVPLPNCCFKKQSFYNAEECLQHLRSGQPRFGS
jgi:4'-phosphopantetheinyl transferase